MSGTFMNGKGQVFDNGMESEELLNGLPPCNNGDSCHRSDGKKENESETRLTWRETIPQLYASLCAHSTVIHAGINMAFSAILLPELEKDNSDIPVTTGDASWIASTVTLGTPIGALLAGPLMDNWGRKVAASVSCIMLIMAWVVIALSSSVAHLCVGRLLAGIGGGLTTVAIVYVSECAHPHLRPALLCLNSVAVSLGVLGTYAASAILPSWRWIAWCSAILAFTSFAVLSGPAAIGPSESPHWLYLFPSPPSLIPKKFLSTLVEPNSQGDDRMREEELEDRRSAAVKVLRRLNPSEVHFAEALLRLELLAKVRVDTGKGKWGLKDILTHSSALRPLQLLLIIFFLQQLSGTYVIVFYAVDVLRGLAGSGKEYEATETIALISLGGMRLLASIFAAILSRHIGRKPLYAASGIGMFISALASGLFDTNTLSSGSYLSPESATWISSIFVLIHVCFAALGVLVIPWTLIGELLPAEARGLGGGISVCIAYAFMFAAVKGFPEAKNAIGGTNHLFLFFSAASLAGVAFFTLCIPETLGHSLQEIETHFKGDIHSKIKWWWGWKVWSKREQISEEKVCSVED